MAKICQKLPWIKMLVTIVHHCSGKLAGCSPKRKMRLGAIRVAINSRKFTAIMTQIEFSLNRR